jgi:transcriptional regulator GlxA family with amidase domain
MTQTQHFSFFLMPEFTHIAFSCALEPLRIANLVSGKPLVPLDPSARTARPPPVPTAR